MAKFVTAKLDQGTARIFNGDLFYGTAVVYAASSDEQTCFQCDFELDTLSETWPQQTRVQRLKRKKSGAASSIRSHQLAHELVVIFGPEMSAKDAIVTLRRLADQIEAEGLLIGRKSGDGDFGVEKATATIK